MSETAEKNHPIRLIYDGDIGPDPCDFSTISALHEYHKRGMIHLIGVAGVTPDPYLASTFSIYNQIYGNDIPIGAWRPGATVDRISDDIKTRYRKALTQFCHADPNKLIFDRYANSNTRTAADVPDSVELYRHLLSQEEDDSVTLYAAGQLFNLEALLQTGADDHSDLNGKELLQSKVKAFIFMGGYFPESFECSWYSETSGAEWNWWAFGSRMTTRTTLEVIVSMGKPVTYVGAEQGPRVLVGNELVARLGRHHPTTESFYLFKPITRIPTGSTEPDLVRENPAFDEITLFHAVEDGVGTYFDRVYGRVQVDENGANSWFPGDGNESYLVIRAGMEGQLGDIVTDRVTGRF
jgi:hypothetical protein